MKWCQKEGSCRAAALLQCYPNLPQTQLSQTELLNLIYSHGKQGAFCLECMQKNSFIQINQQMMDNDENLILWSHNGHWNVWNSGIEKRAASKSLNPGWLLEACWEVFCILTSTSPLLVLSFLYLERRKKLNSGYLLSGILRNLLWLQLYNMS